MRGSSSCNNLRPALKFINLVGVQISWADIWFVVNIGSPKEAKRHSLYLGTNIFSFQIIAYTE
jgi:hypothetical protein